ncbi:alpha/beta hydrolase [Catenulispora sp. NF23]|uniref:alpha/beta fold hydrolase n=1 Tax=Catenulispora pinistramenti TaxID=2705254 RepID=UPI001BA47CA7|nr:alpha/beta hydrolase [Catenulispora pinistramenti]MBS2537299.1 alpha/beta hydrolase [Catenulispora pinistramenti]
MAVDESGVESLEPERQHEEPPEPDHALHPPRRPWHRRVLRRLAKTVAVVFVTLTMLSVPYNAYTAGRVVPPPGLTYVEADGIHTRYVEWGTTGSPIVLVHGAFEDSDTWQDLATLLAQHHRVYALDLTGSGYSQRVAPYTTQHMAAQLNGLVAALGIDHPLLVSHSSGAAVAAEAVLETPHTYSGLMFLDGDGLPIPSPPTWILGPLRTSALRLVLRSDWTIRTIYASQCGPACPRLDAAGVEQFRRPLQVAGAEQGLWGTIDDIGGPGLPASRLAQLRQLCLPKAVTFGAQDSMFAANAPETVAANIGAPAPTVIQGAHHLSLISNPAQVAASVEALAARAEPAC